MGILRCALGLLGKTRVRSRMGEMGMLQLSYPRAEEEVGGTITLQQSPTVTPSVPCAITQCFRCPRPLHSFA